MTHTTPATRCLKLCLIAIAVSPSFKVRADESLPWYLGASGGPTQGTVDDSRILQRLSTGGLPLASIADDSRDKGYKVYGGYHFSPNFALEASYFNVGKYSFAVATTPAGTLNGETRIRGLGLDAVLSAPLTDKLKMSAKLGLNYAQAQDSFIGSGAVTVGSPNPSQTELNPKLGFSLEYALTEAVSVRAEIERYRINDAVGGRGDIDHLTVGLVYSWGLAPPAEPAQEAESPPSTIVETR